MTKMICRRVMMLCLLMALASITVLAQTTNAALTGQVTDPTKAVLPQAKVTAINNGTGVQHTTQTNQSGAYVIPSLPPGEYRIQVERMGFRTIIKPDVVLHVQDRIELNFEMAVGSASETVTVTGGAPMVNTTDASVSTVVDQSYVKNMPLNGRSFQDLILLTPGVVTQTPQIATNGGGTLGATGEFSVNGQRTEENNYMVDGVSGDVGTAPGLVFVANSTASGSLPAETALGTTQALVSVDELQEFRVSTSTYSAEYGRNPGAQMAFQTKSGTNRWHGTADDYLRNGFFDAQNWFNDFLGTPEPALKQNDFGGTLGGAIQKDKTFFFTSYEGLRLIAPQPASINLVVPDNCLRGADPATCQPGETAAPAALLPVLDAYPIPSTNGVNFKDGTAQYISSWSNPGSIDSGSVRLDRVIKDKVQFFFRFNQTSSSSAQRGFGAVTPSTNQITDYTTRTYTGGVTNSFSTHWTNDLRINYSSNNSTYDAVIDPIGGSTPVNVAALSGLTTGASFTLIFHGSQGQGLDQNHWLGFQNQWNLVDTLSYSVGRHHLKFGVDYRRLASHFAVENTSVGYGFYSLSAVENNSAESINVDLYRPSYPLYKNFSAFAEDEWSLTPKLNISMGLRWDVNPPPGVTQGQMPYAIVGDIPDAIHAAPLGTPLWHTTWFNFAPRLGTAYTIRNAPGWQTVLRAGGGVFFDSGQQNASEAFEGPGFFSIAYGSGAFPVSAPSMAQPICDPAQPGCNYWAFPFEQHLQLPYTLQWNTSIEQAFGKSQTLTVSYVGSHASRLLKWNFFFPPPTYQFINYIQNGLTSDYESLQTQFQRRLSGGLTVLGSYSWSHCSDYGSSNAAAGWRRADCDFDVRNNFSSALSYDLPNAGHGRLANAVLHNWGFDNRIMARAAFPVNLVGYGIFEPNGHIVNNGLDFVPGQPVLIYGANCASIMQAVGALAPNQGCPGGFAVNPNAFTPAQDLGQTPRNFLRLFGAWQMDVATRREFPIRESVKLQFRAEAFNVFNHPNFGAVDSGFGDSTFGLITGTLSQSLGVLSPLYQMGGPRSMQFALKLVF